MPKMTKAGGAFRRVLAGAVGAVITRGASGISGGLSRRCAQARIKQAIEQINNQIGANHGDGDQ
jgi:hypothetical protein